MSAVSANCGFEFRKRSQLFIRTHNETLSVVAMCVCNPDCSPVAINRRDAAPTPIAPVEIVCSLLIVGQLRRRFGRFKSATGRTRCGELCAHFLDLAGLLSELGCQSLYLFLLLRDRCFQLLNSAHFAIEHGGALGRRAGCATTHRCATLHRCATTLVRANIPAKVVGRKV